MNAFSLSPNPNLLFQTGLIKTALHKLRYVISERQGLTALLGEPGLGKSSIIRLLISELDADEKYEIGFIATPSFPSDFAFLKAITSQFNVPGKRSYQLQEEAFFERLSEISAAGKHAVLFLDEAQRLLGKQLEVTRTLINFETDTEKLITVVFAAQMELYNHLKDPSKKAIKSRILFPTTLSALSLPDTTQMIEFRCEQAGIPVPFIPSTIKAIYDESHGNPREILKIAAAAYHMMTLKGETVVPPEAIPFVVREARLNHE